MTTNPKPSFSVLVDWIEGRLDASTSAEVERTVAASDPSVRADVEWIRQFIDASRSMPMVDPPDNVKQNIRNEFARRTSPWDAGTYVDTTLVFDSHISSAATGTRSKTSTYPRQFVFQVDEHYVTFEFVDDADHISSYGNVTIPAGADVRPELIFTSRRQVRHTTRCHDDGTFALEAMSRDVDEIWVDSGDTRLRLQIPQEPGLRHDQ